MHRALLISRSLVFVLTSAFYLACPPFSPVMIKIGVVIAVLVATVLAQNLFDSWNIVDLYYKTPTSSDTESPARFPKNYVQVLRLIILEVAGAIMLIMPTGGLESPFVWYALNPIIIAAVFLPPSYCWSTLLIFLGTAIGISMEYFRFSNPLISFLYDHMSIVLVFFLATSLAQLAISLHRSLEKAYSELARAHTAMEKSLQHTASLYQALEAFSTREDRTQLVNVLAVYTNKLCEEPAACFLPASRDGQESSGALLCSADQNGCCTEIDWGQEMSRLWNKMNPAEKVIECPFESNSGHLTSSPIVHNGECFGLLAFWNSPGQKEPENKRLSLISLAGIAGIVLERLKSESLWERLLVSEEQNRIANEIHDGVTQYLFSMSCSLGSILQQHGNLQDENIQEQLQLLQETSRQASQELRASIHKLSPYKRGDNIFMDNLASYLNNLGRLNNIQIDLRIDGSEEILSSALRKGLYRIVREASYNAVRHGKCTRLNVYLSMFPQQTLLEISDNGCGSENLSKNPCTGEIGMGKRNMYQLTACFGGDLEIRSEPGKGTVVRCIVPQKNSLLERRPHIYETGAY